MTDWEAIKAEFKVFFEDQAANVDWDFPENNEDGTVLVDEVFNLDELCKRLAKAKAHCDVSKK